eukprot:TRINITY_DN13522_c0_g1_i7.p1 TRINITY_DN13522_c0_g1~~TRINITY_DN13522_c0_g1_i7.p1  ORF type:complete len:299 (-),score=53.58 TRINITY_DN13522_c0_g1_i7:3-824(-)
MHLESEKRKIVDVMGANLEFELDAYSSPSQLAPPQDGIFRVTSQLEYEMVDTIDPPEVRLLIPLNIPSHLLAQLSSDKSDEKNDADRVWDSESVRSAPTLKLYIRSMLRTGQIMVSLRPQWSSLKEFKCPELKSLQEGTLFSDYIQDLEQALSQYIKTKTSAIERRRQVLFQIVETLGPAGLIEYDSVRYSFVLMMVTYGPLFQPCLIRCQLDKYPDQHPRLSLVSPTQSTSQLVSHTFAYHCRFDASPQAIALAIKGALQNHIHNFLDRSNK